MDARLAKEMDEAMVGPRLFCLYCSESKVLSLCYSCQYSKENDLDEQYCRGCGVDYCIRKYEICKVSEKERLLLEIDKITMREETSVSFAGYDLTQLPAEIGQLANLTQLDLEKNQLTQLPAEIGQLTNLIDLWLSENQSTQLPAEIGQLTNLTLLYLGNNQLTQLPAEICQLTNLIYLSLENNQLTQLPAEIGQLTNLTRLDLENNQLAQFPAEICQLFNLEDLLLGRNNLSERTIKELRKALPNCRIDLRANIE